LHASPDSALRTAGLSANKLASLRDLSAKVLDGTLVLTRTSRRSDEQLIAQLTSVRGIGRWTAEMYLIFQLRRLDVWPVDDLGVRQGYALAWKLDAANRQGARTRGGPIPAVSLDPRPLLLGSRPTPPSEPNPMS
jgi:3-methyladenine DNA glycosylase/8-oxoguanine DNA glycosylase